MENNEDILNSKTFEKILDLIVFHRITLERIEKDYTEAYKMKERARVFLSERSTDEFSFEEMGLLFEKSTIMKRLSELIDELPKNIIENRIKTRLNQLNIKETMDDRAFGFGNKHL